MNVREEAEKLKSKGYNEDDANARICQDIILKGIAASGLSRSVTIKGGVVMRNISHNDRRATQDADLDFIKYSISDDSITEFLRKIESTIGVNITIKPPIATLKHKDYQGKRVFITITDDYGNTLESKLDIGVHKDLDIKQEEYCFDICFQKDGASLLMNSKEQILTEKLKSFLRFGTRSTRYTKNEGAKEFLKENGKDAILYLSENVPLLVRLLRDDVFGREAVAEAFDVVQSGNGNTMMKAYLLQSLHDGDAEKDIRNIQL